VAVVVLGGGVAAWAEVGNGSAGYRTATVTRADIGTTLSVVGNVEPVSDAAASFQVAGQVATVTATPGQVVTAGQTLGALDTTALSESVSSAQSTVAADQAKLVEDEENQTNSSSASAAKTATSTPSSTTTTTTTPSRGTTGGQSATVTADQTALTSDQSTLSTDQNKQAADLAQAQSDCTSANTGTPSGQATCEAALQTVSADEQQVSKDQTAVSKDETALGQALDTESSSGGTSTTTPGSTPTQGSHAVDASSDAVGNTGTGSTAAGAGPTSSGTGATGTGSNGTGSNGSGAAGGNTDTPEQIASDQAAIDSAEADLINAEQSLKEATLDSPIGGTIVSVDIAAGSTVSADSSTDIITIIGTKSYEVEGTLTSSQVPSVKVGQRATVQVDGTTGSLEGTVSQVGPVQSSAGEYSYPVVVDLPATNDTLFTGSTATVDIDTGSVSHVLAVPTSAVETTGSRTSVLESDKGELTRKVIKVGMVGDTYTQVLSGLGDGQSVVLADYSQAVPSSNTDLTNALGGGGGFGGGGFGGAGPGGAGSFRQRISGAGGGGGFTAGG
jgi:HlyD family secretion protein